jgi:FlaA1/EpsC-like NDP-sugar epimerase
LQAGAARVFIVYLIETLTIIVAGIIAFGLRFDLNIPPYYRYALAIALAVWIPVKLVSFRMLELDKRWARYASMPDFLRLGASNVIGSSFALAILVVLRSGVPRTVYVIDFLLCLSFATGSRVVARIVSEAAQPRRGAQDRKRTLIYGAGNAGSLLLRDVGNHPALKYDVCGFIDDDPRKHDLVLHGVRVLGNGDELIFVAPKHRIELVLIAIPAATGAQMKEILQRCVAAGVPYKTVPGLAELIENSGLARQIRDVAVEDLLGRVPVNLDLERISARIEGRVVMVTGAAGSIGSELCRQIARFHPAAIVGFEIAESPLFHLEMQLARAFPDVRFHAEIGSIQDTARLKEVFARRQPSVVYHAAAYKHVPLMEAHVFEAVQNNVFGTLNVVEAAREHDVAEFVMISSDKAVRPASVMGATKRIAELLVRSLQPDGSRFVSVRFGNVLGSNGSVVPIFKEQIARGGPITVTHPEMRRYFMTIPEACQLVLQAAAMGRGGEIFVLDMGEPVKIVDLARNLILLSGLKPEQDIKIAFTGARPGEKLFEELNDELEGLLNTHHEKIRIFAGEDMPRAEVERYLSRFRACCGERNCDELVSMVCQVVPEYRPSAELMDRLRTAEAGVGVNALRRQSRAR